MVDVFWDYLIASTLNWLSVIKIEMCSFVWHAKIEAAQEVCMSWTLGNVIEPVVP